MKRLAFVMLLLVLTSNAYSNAIEEGNVRYHKNCHNCHGPAGMGVASYPKIAGLDFEYVVDRLNRYRSGEKIGSNSGLMISMARKLSDDEISKLAAYLSSIN